MAVDRMGPVAAEVGALAVAADVSGAQRHGHGGRGAGLPARRRAAAGRTAGQASRSARARHAAAQAAFSAAGQGDDFAVHARRPVARRSAGPQTRVDPARWDRLRGQSRIQRRESSQPQADGQPLEIRKVWPVRDRGLRAAPLHRRDCRRHLRYPLDADHDQQSRPAAFFQRRPFAGGPPLARLVDAVWPGLRIAGLAGLRRAFRSGQPAGGRSEQLVERLHAAPCFKGRCCGARSRGS